jgi:hypothetical protein
MRRGRQEERKNHHALAMYVLRQASLFEKAQISI